MALDIPDEYLSVPELMEQRRARARGYSRTLRQQEAGPEPLGNESLPPEPPSLKQYAQPEQLGYRPDQLSRLALQGGRTAPDEQEPPRFAPPPGGRESSPTSTPTQAPGVVRRTASTAPAPAPAPAGAGPVAPGAPGQAPGPFTPAPNAAPGAPAPGGAPGQLDMSPGALRQRATEASLKAIDASTKLPDMSGQVERYKREYEAAGPDIGLAMFMQGVGGKMGDEMGGQIFKQALARRQPEKTAYGTLDYAGGFQVDPMKQREMEIGRLEKMAVFQESQATHAETAAERERAHKEAERLRELQFKMHQQTLGETARHNKAVEGQGHYLPIKDADGNVSAVLDTRSGNITDRSGQVIGGGGAPGTPGQPGQQYPAKPGAKATEDEKRTASQVQRIISSAGLMTPEGAAPGVGEAVVGAIPRVGDAAASAVRGASGTMGVGQPSRQSTYQSQTDIIDALLWLSTGAAYSKEQMQNMRESYMPLYTDNAKAKADKLIRLQGMIDSAKTRAGRAWTQDAENALQRALPALTGGGAAPDAKPPSALPRARVGQQVNDLKREVGGG